MTMTDRSMQEPFVMGVGPSWTAKFSSVLSYDNRIMKLACKVRIVNLIIGAEC